MLFKIELASEQDSKDIFNLSNDQSVRNVSFRTETIGWDQHAIWFNDRIKDKVSVFNVIRTEVGVFIGYVRFDYSSFLLDCKEYVITIHLDSRFRGKGLGKQILSQASILFFQTHADVKRIFAFVKEKNLVSLKIFNFIGYKLVGKVNYNSVKFFKLCFLRT